MYTKTKPLFRVPFAVHPLRFYQTPSPDFHFSLDFDLCMEINV